MNFKQSVNLLLIALFVWAFQSTTIHDKHHIIDEISECYLCDVSEQMELYQHNTPIVMVNEHLAVQSRREVEKVVVKARFDYSKVPNFKPIDIPNSREYSVASIPLGFNATAPPLYFS
ncbi:MAG: hypothetical protein Q9M39_09440 [Sulfurovum sp.]|nr:hypothetical protein [Sulfurovum sp.]